MGMGKKVATVFRISGYHALLRFGGDRPSYFRLSRFSPIQHRRFMENRSFFRRVP